MRDFSKVAPQVWRSKKFRSLNDRGRLLYLYLLTCPHANSAGCYNLPIGYATHDLGWSDKSVLDTIGSLCDTLLIGYNEAEETVFINNWFIFNPAQNPKHAKKLYSEILGQPACEQKIQCFHEFIAHLNEKGWDTDDYDYDIVSKGYRKGMGYPLPLDKTIQDETRLKEEEVRGRFKKPDIKFALKKIIREHHG